MVRVEGLEPPRVAPLVPKTSASANSATPALPRLMGWLTGFEPATTRTTTEGSTAELQPPHKALLSRDYPQTVKENPKTPGQFNGMKAMLSAMPVVKIMRHILHNKEIALINLHTALQRYSNKALDVFGAIYFLNLGIAFHIVTLVWAASFVLRFLLRPLSLKFSERFGLKTALIFGTTISSGIFLIFPFVDGVNIWLFVFAVGLAIFDIFYWLPYHAFYTVIGDENKRGLQIALRSGLVDGAQILAPLLGGIMAAKLGFWALYGSAMLVMLVSAIPIFFMKDHSPGVKMGLREAMGRIDKRGLIMQIGDGIHNNAHFFLWTIVLFLLTNDFINFGALITFELFVTVILSFILGHYIDAGKGRWIAHMGPIFLAVAVLARVFWVTTIPQIILLNFVSAIGITFLAMPYQVSINNLAKRTHNALWFHFFGEIGWDIGAAFVFTTAALLSVCGVELRDIMLLALSGLVIVDHVLKRYYKAR